MSEVYLFVENYDKENMKYIRRQYSLSEVEVSAKKGKGEEISLNDLIKELVR